VNNSNSRSERKKRGLAGKRRFKKGNLGLAAERFGERGRRPRGGKGNKYYDRGSEGGGGEKRAIGG